MADRIKNYEINYNITSNALEAARGFNSLLYYVDQLSGKNKYTGLAQGITALNGEINGTVRNLNNLKNAFAEIRPEIDMSAFRSQIGQMQRAVSEFAQQTRNIMRMAMSGTDKQFAKARGAMAGDIFDTSSLRYFEDELKKMPQKISDATKDFEKAKKIYDDAVNTPITYPKGATAEQQKDIDDRAKKERASLLRNLKEREKILKGYQEQESSYKRSIENLRGSLSSASLAPIAGPAAAPKTIPAGYQKAIDLIPKWQQEYERTRAAALAKRAELAKTISEPQRIAKPDFWSKIGLYNLMRDYDNEVRKYASNQSDYQKGKMEAARSLAMGGFGLAKKDAEFDELHRQYRAYDQYREQYRNWVNAGKPQGQPYNQSEEYKNYRAALKRLRAAYGIQRQAEALRATMASSPVSAPTGGGGGALPPILGIPPQIMEQAYTGKLTLVPDVAAARAAIAAEKFSANLTLVPLISELRTKLNAETFKVNVTPSIAKTKGKATGAIGTLQEEIDALQRSAKAPITVGTHLDRGGLLGRAQSGYNTLQTLANRHPITYKLASDGSGGFSLNQALTRLAQLAKSRPVPFRMVHDGSGAFSLNQALARLQTLASTRPIAISLNANIGNLQTAITKALTTNAGGPKSFPIDIKPRVGGLSQSIRNALTGTGGTPKSFFVDIKARTNSLISSITRALRGRSFDINAKLNTSNLAGQVPLLERLQQVWAKLPRTGTRTYTVNLKTTGLGDIAKIERVIALVNSLPSSKTKNYRVNTVSGNTGGTTSLYAAGGASGGRIYSGRGDDLYSRSRKWAYPFTGNTSFGARTPAALDMIKGMGMMTGIGGAMSVVSNSFSDAVSYQNTMETAKAILKDNYSGGNFDQDYDSMVRVVRDVAMRTKFTAPEAADAARFMAMAGLNIPMIKTAIAPIADVAAISDTDLGLVADKMTNIMTEFNVAPQQMRNLADMMTNTFTSTNTDMMMLAESLQYAGPMAFASGQSLAETLAMIGIMGNSGIQASMAGTTMRMMLQNLYNPNKNQAKFMQQIGLQTRDANGNRRSLFEILSDISRLTGTNDSKNVVGNLLAGKDNKNNIDTFDAASKLFRVTAAAGGASLLGNIEKVGRLIQQIQGANGNSEAVSIAKQNTIAGMWAQAKSAFTEAVVKVFEDSDMQKLLKDTLGKLIDYLKQPEFIDNIRKVFDLIVNVTDVLGMVIKGWMWIYDKFGGIVNEVIKWQFIFTNIGYALTPIIQLIGLISTLGGSLRGALGIGVASNLTAIARAGGITGIVGSAMNLAPNSTVGSALVGGSVKGGRFEQIYAERAAMYRAAAARQYDMIGTFAAGRWMAGMSDSDKNALQQMLGRRDRLRMMGDQYGMLAMQSAMINRQRKVSQLQNTNLLYRAARQGRLSWGNLGRGMGTAFTTAFTANTMSKAFGGAWASVRGGFASITTTLAKGAGLLLNPATLAAGALGGLAVAAGVAIYNFYKTNAAWQEGIKNSGVQFREELRKAWGSDTGLSNIFDHVQTVHITAANVELGDKNNNVPKSIKEDENLKTIFEVLNSEIGNGAMKYGKVLKGVSDATYREAYSQYIEPMRDLLPLSNPDQFELFLDANEGRELLAAADITRAIIGKKGTESGLYKQSIDEMLKRASELQKLPIDQQILEWDKYIADLYEIAQKLNPQNQYGLSSITTGNFQRALGSSPAQYREYWQAGYNSLIRFIDESPALKAVQAIHNLNTGVVEYTDDWWKNITELVGSIKFDDENYQKLGEIQFPVRNGVIQLQELDKIIADKNEIIANKVGTYLKWMNSIYDMFYNDPVLGAYIKNVSRTDFLSHMLGYQDYKYPSFVNQTQDWNGWGNAKPWNMWSNSTVKRNEYDIQIPNYVGTSNVSTPSTPSPGADYEWNPYINTWVKKAGANTTTPATPTNTNPAGNNANPTTPQPTAYTPSNLNSGYESSYSKNAARPTQVVININDLMKTDKIVVASDAEERQLANAMEDKIEQALDILRGQIVMSLNRGDYSLG